MLARLPITGWASGCRPQQARSNSLKAVAIGSSVSSLNSCSSTSRSRCSSSSGKVARQWLITDRSGTVQQVRGLGVVGHQPLLKPGEQFEYTSWAQIQTPQGSMRGSFFGVTVDAQWFESPVAEFALADTTTLH